MTSPINMLSVEFRCQSIRTFWKVLFLLGLGKSRLVALALCPRALVCGHQFLTFGDAAILDARSLLHRLQLERVERPWVAPHALQNMLAREYSHGERMEGLAFELFAALHVKFLEFAVKSSAATRVR